MAQGVLGVSLFAFSGDRFDGYPKRRDVFAGARKIPGAFCFLMHAKGAARFPAEDGRRAFYAKMRE